MVFKTWWKHIEQASSLSNNYIIESMYKIAISLTYKNVLQIQQQAKPQTLFFLILICGLSFLRFNLVRNRGFNTVKYKF